MTPPPSSSPLVEKVAATLAEADGEHWAECSGAQQAKYHTLALAAVRVVVEAAAEVASDTLTAFMRGPAASESARAAQCDTAWTIISNIKRLLPSEPEA